MDDRAQPAIRQFRIVHVGVCLGIVILLGLALELGGRLVQARLSEGSMLAGLALCALGCAAAHTVVQRGAARGLARLLRVPQILTTPR